MNKPSFLIIGAARSGTTTLAQCLNLHPKIFMPETDHEPKFFSREPEFEKGIEYYMNTYFSSAEKHQTAGEKSTEYMESLISAKRIHLFHPNMKIIYILRHPVERVISNYWWSVYNGFELRPIEYAIRSEFEKYLKHPRRISKIYSTCPHAYIERSLYFDNLVPFHHLFAPKNIIGFLFEEFISNKNKITEKIFNFLGIEAMNLPVDSVRINRHVNRTKKLSARLYEELSYFYKEKNRDLSPLTGLNTDDYWNAP